MKKRKTKKKKTAKKKSKPVQNPVEVTPYPEAGPKVVEFERILDEKLEAGEVKRGRGRPRKDQAPEPAEPDNITSELIAGTVKLPFELWSIQQGIEDLGLTDKEARQLATPVKQLLDYYLPKIPPIAYAWLSLSVTTFWIMRSRLLLIAVIKKQNTSSTKKSVDDNSARDDQERGPGGPRPPTDKFPKETKTVKM